MKRKIVEFINKTGGFFGINIIKVHSSWNNPLAMYGLSKTDYSQNKDNTFTLKKANIIIEKKAHKFFLESYTTVKKLIDRLGATFFIDSGDVVVEVCGIRYCLTDKIDLFVLEEVFLEGAYNLKNLGSNTVLIDIGMNVGITSLYFASKKEIIKTYSYEPFTPTYNLAKKNLALNRELASKVNAFNTGLGESESILEVDFFPDNKAIMSIYGNENTKKLPNVSKESIKISNAAKAFLQIKKENPDNEIVCKMDCEGAEYEIIAALTSGKAISIPNVYMIEWHQKRPSEIVESLSSQGYYILQTTLPTGAVGMIYAFRSSHH